MIVLMIVLFDIGHYCLIPHVLCIEMFLKQIIQASAYETAAERVFRVLTVALKCLWSLCVWYDRWGHANFNNNIQGGPKKVRPLRLKAHIFCLRLQNAWTNFHDFWHTATPFSAEHICWSQIHQIYCTKWCHLAKVNNLSFAVSKRYESSA